MNGYFRFDKLTGAAQATKIVDVNERRVEAMDRLLEKAPERPEAESLLTIAEHIDLGQELARAAQTTVQKAYAEVERKGAVGRYPHAPELEEAMKLAYRGLRSHYQMLKSMLDAARENQMLSSIDVSYLNPLIKNMYRLIYGDEGMMKLYKEVKKSSNQRIMWIESRVFQKNTDAFVSRAVSYYGDLGEVKLLLPREPSGEPPEILPPTASWVDSPYGGLSTTSGAHSSFDPLFTAAVAKAADIAKPLKDRLTQKDAELAAKLLVERLGENVGDKKIWKAITQPGGAGIKSSKDFSEAYAIYKQVTRARNAMESKGRGSDEYNALNRLREIIGLSLETWALPNAGKGGDEKAFVDQYAAELKAEQERVRGPAKKIEVGHRNTASGFDPSSMDIPSDAPSLNDVLDAYHNALEDMVNGAENFGL